MRKRVLVVEDNDQNMYLITYILEDRGYEVIPAADGGEGIRLAREFQPDVILLDIQLPVMDGYEVARRLKSIERFKDTPLIAVTSYAMPGDREKAIEAGCNGYIEKPINPSTFIAEVESFLKQGDGPGEEG